jgi:SpoVK/Ycf46/Vps4 family AAA+-type ATPase
MKILKILLAKENLESDFKFDELANATEGYSGSDLKVLCLKPSITAPLFSATERFTAIHFHLRVCTYLVSYLQNLCIAAAYWPVHELLEEEKKVA